MGKSIDISDRKQKIKETKMIDISSIIQLLGNGNVIIDSALNNKKESDILKNIIEEIILINKNVRHINSLRISRPNFPVKRPSFRLKFGEGTQFSNYEGNINREEIFKFIIDECENKKLGHIEKRSIRAA